MASSPIDLRSDTVTRPTPEMRSAIAAAPVGDDQFGDDPTVNLLQERVAALLGKEAALWLPTGTMANQVALRLLTRPGDEVAVPAECHLVWHETGGGAANAGVQFRELGRGGCYNAEEFLAARTPRGHQAHPPTTLLEIENTHNRAGGVVVPHQLLVELCGAARAHDVATYLDGARLWNAAAASGRSPRELAAPFDLVSVAMSKGLGCPAGSLLAGPRDLITRAVRQRRMLGGAMRQVGLLAAAALFALDHHVDRLPEDHGHARLLAQALAASPDVQIDLSTVQTNIVVFHLPPHGPDAPAFVAAARSRGVLVVPFGARIVRAVTHLDVSREHCARAAEVLVEVAATGREERAASGPRQG